MPANDDWASALWLQQHSDSACFWYVLMIIKILYYGPDSPKLTPQWPVPRLILKKPFSPNLWKLLFSSTLTLAPLGLVLTKLPKSSWQARSPSHPRCRSRRLSPFDGDCAQHKDNRRILWTSRLSKDLMVEVVLALGVSGLLTASKGLLVSNVCHAVDP